MSAIAPRTAQRSPADDAGRESVGEPGAHQAQNQHTIAAAHAATPVARNTSGGICHQQAPAAASDRTSGTGRGPRAGGSSAPRTSPAGGSIHATASQMNSPAASAAAASGGSALCSSAADAATSAARPARPSHGASRRIPVLASVLLKSEWSRAILPGHAPENEAAGLGGRPRKSQVPGPGQSGQ